MEKEGISFDELEIILIEYEKKARDSLKERWKKWKIDLSKNEMYEVIGGLLARQLTFATQMAMNPGLWNAHISPIILRCMTDVYINLAWILKDPLIRSQMFIKFGLGQLKLEIEHRKKQIIQDGLDPNNDQIVKANEDLLNSQRLSFLTEINLGKWSEMDSRKMAIDAGCLDFYRYSYTPFSAAVHSMWHHICRYNMKYCKNPLHKYHRVPDDPDLSLDPFFLLISAKNLNKTFNLFDTYFKIRSEMDSPYVYIHKELGNLNDKGNEFD